MLKYIRNRLLLLLPVLLGITFLSFAMMSVTASDAVDMKYENMGVEVSQEVKDQRRAELGLDKPFLVQYGVWLNKLAHGDMGTSYISGEKVVETFFSKLPRTIFLAVSAMTLTLLISLPLGVFSAIHKDKLGDRVVLFLTFIGNSMPNFFVALLLILFFSVKLNWLPIIAGSGTQGIILPTLTLTLAMSAKYIRQIRTAVLDEMGKSYVQAARMRGIREHTIFYKSMLHVVLFNVITLIALSMGSLLGGTAIVETVFSWDGVGKLAVDAINMRDYPVIQAYVVWLAVIYICMNLVADILYRLVDPRIKKVGS
jgi:peptide/nickel transport system permease protein